MNKNIGDKISRAIKENKWLNISYINKSGENTFYWIAVKDIDFETKKLQVFMFNERKSVNTFETWISFENILSAEVIDFSSYDIPEKLIDKIENNLDKCQWLNYDHFNHNILNYYIECNILDSDPSQTDYVPIQGIDVRNLRKEKVFHLTDVQIKKIVEDIYCYDINKVEDKYNTLAINDLSISKGNDKFVVSYYELKFDPVKKSLVLDKKRRINQSFLIRGRRHSLFNYINMDADEFTNTFSEKCDEYIQMIAESLKAGEVIDTRPDIMLLQREMPANLEETYNIIETKYHTNALSTPLKSFFGNITKRNNIRRKEPSLIIYDRKINISQMRALYNSMKYPVTYVEGPPGTGKTQTIVNVVLSAFFNDKSVLVCSSNNKPVNGIIEKLQFTYREDTVNFPYLRLGNFEEVKKATLRIRELYNFSTNKQAQEDKLDKIKTSSDERNAKLIELLNEQEKRIDIENYLENSQRLIDSFEDKSSKLIDVAKKRVEQLKEKLATTHEITNEEITSLFYPLKENYLLSQFLFFKSLEYISKLKKPRFVELIRICNIEDDDERASEFNKWAQDDENMKKLTEVFPVIFSTNISSRRLGTPKFMFNLVIMDEAGQCNVATALLPIAKAESLLLVGDPNQLKPVIILEDHINEELVEKYNVPTNYNYKNHSIWDVMIAHDNISKYVQLKYHYRCGRKIIGFSNQRYYNNSLNLEYVEREGFLQVLDVKNKNIKRKNEAFDEACAVVDYIERNKVTDAHIITPFVNQKEIIQTLLKQRNITGIECGTIHSIQGAEKDTIILSTALSAKTSKGTFKWIKDNYELINVAVTRAKNKLIIAADTEVLEKLSNKQDDLYNLVQYAKNNGGFEVPPNESIKIEIGKSNGSIAEDEFFKTITHFCSCHKTFDTDRNVKISKLIKGDDSVLPNEEFDLVLFEKGIFSAKKPVIAFEVNGGEHFGISKRESSDKKKMELCKKHGIKLVIIPNAFVKAYEYIAEIILSLKDGSKPIQQTIFDIM